MLAAARVQDEVARCVPSLLAHPRGAGTCPTPPADGGGTLDSLGEP